MYGRMQAAARIRSGETYGVVFENRSGAYFWVRGAGSAESGHLQAALR